jgi:hypothetical protein
VLAVGGGGRGTGEEAGASRHRHAGDEGRQVLQEVRDAGERAIGEALGDGQAGQIVELHHDGIDRGIARLHPLDGGFQQVSGGNLAPADEVGEA